mgnify:CR=1 FL=1|jgi:hypothetical protein
MPILLHVSRNGGYKDDKSALVPDSTIKNVQREFQKCAAGGPKMWSGTFKIVQRQKR